MADRSEEYPGMPRWVKITGIVLLIIVLIAVAVVALGIGGPHGPGRHGPSRHTGADTNASASAHDGASPVAEGARVINVTAKGLAFTPFEISVPVGTNVAIALTSVDTLHDFVIDELDMHVASDAGETNQGGFHAGPPGTYTFYCSQPGHRDAGMQGTLVVTGGH